MSIRIILSVVALCAIIFSAPVFADSDIASYAAISQDVTEKGIGITVTIGDRPTNNGHHTNPNHGHVTATRTATCSATCSNTCRTTCRTTCSSTCRTTCRTTCSSTCSNTCRTTCSYTCKNTCRTTCSSTCSYTCSNTCSYTCSNTCSNTCNSTCSYTCSNTCSYTCSYSCQNQTEAVLYLNGDYIETTKVSNSSIYTFNINKYAQDIELAARNGNFTIYNARAYVRKGSEYRWIDLGLTNTTVQEGYTVSASIPNAYIAKIEINWNTGNTYYGYREVASAE